MTEPKPGEDFASLFAFKWFSEDAPQISPQAHVDPKANIAEDVVFRSPAVFKPYEGYETVASTSEWFSQYIQSEIVKWTKVIKDAGIKKAQL